MGFDNILNPPMIDEGFRPAGDIGTNRFPGINNDLPHFTPTHPSQYFFQFLTVK